MKRICAVLMIVVLLLTTLSGCELMENYKRNKDLKAAESALKTVSETTSMDYSMDMTLHMEGRELDVQVAQDATISYSNLYTDALCLDMRSSTTVKMEEAEEDTSTEQSFHFEDGMAYVNVQDMPYAKEAMTAKEFLDFAGLGDNESSKFTGFEEYSKQTYDTSSETENVLTLEEDSQHNFPWLLSVTGIAEDCVTASEYLAVETYVFDKKMTLKSMTTAITCNLLAFGESYTVKFNVTIDVYALGKDVRVQNLLGEDKYLPVTDMAERLACIQALQVTGQYASCKISEKEEFNMTSAVPEKYHFTVSRDIEQQISESDVAIESEIKQNYEGKLGSQSQNQSWKHDITLNKGILTTTTDGKSTKADYVNPFNYYAVIPSVFYPNGALEADYIDSFRAEEKDGKLTCSYTLTTDMTEGYIGYYLSVIWGEEGGAALMNYIKATDIKQRSCVMVIDQKTGGILSQTISLELESTIESVKYDIKYTYSLTVQDAVASQTPEVGLPV